jgi:hypothetical protein
MTSSTIYNDILPIFAYYNRNNSWKPYVYIVFTTGRLHGSHMYILFLPRVGFYRPTRGKNNIYIWLP